MSTPQKCVHKGCGQTFTDPTTPPCVYHPGPPEFHEGQKGWKCCKPRVLTFDEFLTIPPCTTGTHSAVDDGPKVEFSDTSKIGEAEVLPAGGGGGAEGEGAVRKVKPLSERAKESLAAGVAQAQGLGTPLRSSTPQPGQVLEEDSDEEEGLVGEEEVKVGTTCKRKACGEQYQGGKRVRGEEKCVFHPGLPIFHEGSKGYTCCKRKVLEFDEFMRIKGCKEREGHCFVGKREKAREAERRKAREEGGPGAGEEKVEEVRNDYYQTPTSVIVSFFLKKIRKEDAKVLFGVDGENGYVDLDLPTADHKRFSQRIVFWGEIDPDKSTSKVMGTKLELTVAKRGDGLTGWPVLKHGDRETGERIQVGRAGRA